MREIKTPDKRRSIDPPPLFGSPEAFWRYMSCPAKLTEIGDKTDLISSARPGIDHQRCRTGAGFHAFTMTIFFLLLWLLTENIKSRKNYNKSSMSHGICIRCGLCPINTDWTKIESKSENVLCQEPGASTTCNCFPTHQTFFTDKPWEHQSARFWVSTWCIQNIWSTMWLSHPPQLKLPPCYSVICCSVNTFIPFSFFHPFWSMSVIIICCFPFFLFILKC